MEHIYEEHRQHRPQSLNGDWAFCPDPRRVGKNEEWYRHFPADARAVCVPGCWNSEPGLFSYAGTAWYKKEFCTKDCFLRIEFGAVSGYAEVYLDGEFLGDHYGGWGAFSVAKNVMEGRHTLVLSVDASSNDRNTIPLQKVDWYHYGGITRSVQFTEYDNPCIGTHRISYDLDEGLTSATLNVTFRLENLPGAGYATPVRICLDDTLLYTENHLFDETGRFEIRGIRIPDIRLWDVGKPALYKVTIETADDDLTEQIGFRRVEVRGDKVYLNGRPVFFRGVNRHEEHPDWGFALPANLQKRDVEILKDLHCNIVRGSHYPNSHTFLDYLDREGILFWSEIPMWGFPAAALADPLTKKRGLDMHREMIEQYYHHPCIVLWGLHNEIDTSSEAAYEITRAFSECVRKADGSRPITYATCHFHEDICLEFADVVALNYYFGWYRGTVDDWDKFFEEIPTIAAARHAGGKPVVISEFGCAAIAGYSHFSDDKWTMQYQSELIEKVITLAKKNDRICGTFVWQFADIKSDMDINRARSFNNKGILDEYRRPKFAYYTVKRLYTEDGGE